MAIIDGIKMAPYISKNYILYDPEAKIYSTVKINYKYIVSYDLQI